MTAHGRPPPLKGTRFLIKIKYAPVALYGRTFATNWDNNNSLERAKWNIREEVQGSNPAQKMVKCMCLRHRCFGLSTQNICSSVRIT